MRRLDRLTWLLLGLGVLLLLYAPVASAVNDLVTQYRLAQDRTRASQNVARTRATQQTRNAQLAANGLVPNAPDFTQRFAGAGDLTAHLIGHLAIPRLGLAIPLFDATTPALLAQGAGVVPGTSFPLGGPSTHSVIAAHNGLPGQPLFTHLDRLQVADRFSVTVGPQTMTYRVIALQVVRPEQVDAVRLRHGQDLVTLLTCTPLMQNTHRLLVTGRRTATTPATQAATQHALARRRQTDWCLLLGLVITGCTLGGLALRARAGHTRRP
ncbi:class C sortase [Lacticaseibacillus absianus]|uniref:class C sortase n=1 Tax=Lacticaseibacillus absianus TaxID=2729623 RepID=UPI0015CA3D3F|nr:class C sortase [Lacticaseibacillus absianus]